MVETKSVIELMNRSSSQTSGIGATETASIKRQSLRSTNSAYVAVTPVPQFKIKIHLKIPINKHGAIKNTKIFTLHRSCALEQNLSRWFSLRI